MPDEIGQLKRGLRAEVRARRLATPPEERHRLAAALSGHLIELSYTLGVTSLAAYVSTASEPGTRSFLDWAAAHDLAVIVPVALADGLLDWARYSPLGERGETQREGGTDQPIGPEHVDLILVPASSVDRTGLRMGWGRGYYDRLLANTARERPVYAVIFDSELVESLPSEPHDQHVDGVVTPSGITTFTN
jgi:5-formyltetrahydrofolate cyclo-ligase